MYQALVKVHWGSQCLSTSVPNIHLWDMDEGPPGHSAGLASELNRMSTYVSFFEWLDLWVLVTFAMKQRRGCDLYKSLAFQGLGC